MGRSRSLKLRRAGIFGRPVCPHAEKARCHNADMHVAGESDGSIVPEKQTNKAGTPVAEFVEERGPPEGMLCGFALVLDTEPGL